MIIDDYADDHGLELLKRDGFGDECVAGVLHRYGMEPIVVYPLDKVIESLESQGMSHEEALEFFDFNVIGAWLGDLTPGFLEEVPYKTPDGVCHWQPCAVFRGEACDCWKSGK